MPLDFKDYYKSQVPLFHADLFARKRVAYILILGNVCMVTGIVPITVQLGIPVQRVRLCPFAT